MIGLALRLLAGVLANLNALLFAAGLVVLYVGLAGWSRPLAWTVLGVILMLVAVWPILMMRHR